MIRPAPPEATVKKIDARTLLVTTLLVIAISAVIRKVAPQVPVLRAAAPYI